VANSKKNSGIKGGVEAGIGIGGLLIGALLALLFAFIFMKRSRKHRSSGHRHSSSFDTEKNLTVAPIASSTLDETLLDRADDSQLRKSMQDLSELLDQHVENNYHLEAFEGSQGPLEKMLVEAGYSTEPGESEIAALLVNPRTRFAAIREVIARILVGNLEVRSRPELSLLPPQIVGFVKSIPPVERLGGADNVFDKAFTKWRHLSAFLIEPSRTSREAPKANEREIQAAIGRNVALINAILKPFINPGLESQRSQENNLRAIILEGAQLGLLLFSQPSVWAFSWKVPIGEESSGNRAGRPFIVFPALGEKIERHGRQRLREVSAPVVIEL
jgi:hypothetical protein